MKLIVILRGHIRNSFDDRRLYDFILSLTKLYEVEIHISTWNIQQNNCSWRGMDYIPTKITALTLLSYFNIMSEYIKNIIINDDSEIKLIGNTEGRIGSGPAPLIGWKRYWFCKHKLNELLKSSIKSETPIFIG